MMLFQVAQKGFSRKETEQGTEWLSAQFKSAGGAAQIMAVPRQSLISAMKSEQLFNALKNPDGWSAAEKKNFVSNLEKLGNDNKFADMLQEAYSQKDSKHLRWLLGHLYHSGTGQEALGKLGFLFGIKTFLKESSLSEEELRKDYEHFKYPEKVFRASELAQEQQAAYLSMERYIKTGNEADRDYLFSFAQKYPIVAGDLLRVQEVRPLYAEALKKQEARERVRELFLASETREMFSNALDTAEGSNTLGYLWNTQAGRAFVIGFLAVPVSKPWKTIDMIRTVQMIFDKQTAFQKKAKEAGQSYESSKERSKTATRALESVPLLVHKKEYDSVVKPEMEYLKEKYQGKLPDKEFEKRVQDAFERFYYDATKGAGGTLGGKKVKEVDPTPLARKVVKNEYLMLKTDEQRNGYLFEGMEMYLKEGVQKARDRIANDNETGILPHVMG